MTHDYHVRRDMMLSILEEVGFQTTLPEGAYYTMADYTQLDIPQAKWGFQTLCAMARHRDRRGGCVPGTSFYSLPAMASTACASPIPKS